MRPASHWVALGAGCLVAWAGIFRGVAASEVLTVPNGSFELPATPFVSLQIDSWQRTPKPDGYVEEGGFQWGQLTGIFLNTATTAADHIGNMEGRQAAWIFAVPGAGLFQAVRTATGSEPARFEPGRSYRLSVDVLGGGGNMLPGVTLDLSLFAWDASSNRVPVMTLTVTNTPDLFPINTRFVRFAGATRPVREPDPFAGAVIQVGILSTATQGNEGGYWDVDRVVVESVPEHRPALVLDAAGGDLRLRWGSEVGWRYRVRSSRDLVSWAAEGGETVGTGSELSVSVGAGADNGVFFDLVANPPE